MKSILTTFLAALAAIAINAAPADSTRTDKGLEEVVVTGTRNQTDARHLPLTVTQISREKIEEHARFSLIPTIMEQTPGLFSTSRGVIGYGVSTNSAGALKVRGVGSGPQLMVLIDGQPQYAGLMGHPIPDAYQTMMAEKVEVLRGPASLYYGSNAMGGVINIITRAMPQNGSETQATVAAGSYGTMQAELANRTRFGKFSTSAGASYQRTDGHRTNSNFEQASAFLKIGYDLCQNWKLNADLSLTHFNFSDPGPVSAPLLDAEAHITRGLTSFSITNSYKRTSGSLRAYYDWGHHKINDGHLISAAPREYLYKHNDFIGGISWYQSAALFRGNRTTVGVDWQHFGGEAWNAYFNGTKSPYEGIENQDEVAGYVDFRQSLAPWMTIDAGLRIDHHSQTGTELIPQAGLAFSLTPQHSLKALVSKGFRNPIIREMYMFPPANPNLKPERMMNYELSYNWRFNRGHFNANLFYINGDNLINTIKNPSGPGKLNLNTGKFENWGFELSGDYQICNNWSIDANYSFLHMNHPVTAAPESKLYVGTHYRTGKWDIAAGLQNVAGLYLTTGEKEKKENFTLLNATVSYQLIKPLTLFVKGDNLLAQRYETYDGFPMPKATFMAGARLRF